MLVFSVILASFWWRTWHTFIGLLLPISEQLAIASAFFLYILPGARFRALSAGVHCTLQAAGWKPTRNHILITVGFFHLHKGWLSLHRGHPVNVPIRRSMLLSKSIPANDTRESVFRLSLWAGIEPGTSSSRGKSANHWATIRSVHVRVRNYAKCKWKFQKCEPKIFVQQILQINLLLCAVIQSTHKSIYFVWKLNTTKLCSVVFI